jgi:hypothetical protein
MPLAAGKPLMWISESEGFTERGSAREKHFFPGNQAAMTILCRDIFGLIVARITHCQGLGGRCDWLTEAHGRGSKP